MAGGAPARLAGLFRTMPLANCNGRKLVEIAAAISILAPSAIGIAYCFSI
jgi:hypothetical protein